MKAFELIVGLRGRWWRFANELVRCQRKPQKKTWAKGSFWWSQVSGDPVGPHRFPRDRSPLFSASSCVQTLRGHVDLERPPALCLLLYASLWSSEVLMKRCNPLNCPRHEQANIFRALIVTTNFLEKFMVAWWHGARRSLRLLTLTSLVASLLPPPPMYNTSKPRAL